MAEAIHNAMAEGGSPPSPTQVREAALTLGTMYQEVLGRQLDINGAAVYAKQLKDGRTPERIKEELLTSGEFRDRVRGESEKNREAAVADIYHSVFGRDLDPGGRDAYVTNTSLSTDQIIDEVVGSQEFRDMQREAAIHRELDQVYKTTLGRGVDPEGAKVYAEQIRSGRSISDITLELRRSDEYATLHRDASGSPASRQVEQRDLPQSPVPEQPPAAQQGGQSDKSLRGRLGWRNNG